MKLTALEIKQQAFEKSLRGYDIGEVKAFLNVVSSEWEFLVTKNRDLERELSQVRDKLKHYERVESALHETLQTAKESAEQRLAGAKKDAKNRIDKADMEAENIVREALQERQEIRQNILRLIDRRNEIIRGIKSYLDLANESLSSFSRDEAGVFDIPKEADDIELKIKTRVTRKDINGIQGESDTKEKKFKAKGESAALMPDADDIDDLIDEIE